MESHYENLRRYCSEIADHELLGREGEALLASHIEEAEIEVWKRVISFTPGLSLVLDSLQASAFEGTALPAMQAYSKKSSQHGSIAKKRRPSAKMIRAWAAQLRAQDRDRIHLSSVLEAIKARKSRAKNAQQWQREISSATHVAAQARQRFINANLRFVVSMSRRYKGHGVPLEDLIQEGNIGLIKAVDRFEYRKGYRFSTYAGWWIRHSMGRAVANAAHTVRRPVHLQESNQKIVRAQRELSAKLAREPTYEEVAEMCEFSLERVIAVRRLFAGSIVSLDEQIGEDDTTRLDLLVDPANDERSVPAQVIERENVEQVQELLQALTPIQSDILAKRFGLGGTPQKTLKSIGEEYGLSRERIRQVQVSALEELRNALKRQERKPNRSASNS